MLDTKKKWLVKATNKGGVATYYVKASREEFAKEIIWLRHQHKVIWAEQLADDTERECGWIVTW